MTNDEIIKERTKNNLSIPTDEEIEEKAEQDWNNNNYPEIQYKGQDKIRHHRIFSKGYNQALKDLNLK